MSTSHKEKIIRVLQLFQTTDEKTPMNAVQISQKLEEEYGMENVHRTSIYDDVRLLQSCGYPIKQAENSHKGWYMEKHLLEDWEIKLMLDSVQQARCVSVHEANEIRNKLLNLTSQRGRSRFSHMIMPLPGNVRGVGQIGEYIEIMLEAMYLHKKIRFQYTEINNATCIVECTKKIEEYEAVILDRNSILDRGKTIIKFNNASFTKKYFEQKKQEIQDLNEKIKNLDETIRAFSDGNEIIEALTNLIDKKQALAEYQRLRLGEGIQVRCPVCGSEKFAEIETQQILKEASDFLEVNKTNLNKKVEEKELKKRECNELKDELILKAKEVLKTEIQKETESRENLLNVQKSTKEFFVLQKRISSVVKDTNEIYWWSEADNLIDKKQKLEKRQISKEEMNKKQREVEYVLNLLNFKIEVTDSDQAIQNKISSVCRRCSTNLPRGK